MNGRPESRNARAHEVRGDTGCGLYTIQLGGETFNGIAYPAFAYSTEVGHGCTLMARARVNDEFVEFVQRSVGNYSRAKPLRGGEIRVIEAAEDLGGFYDEYSSVVHVNANSPLSSHALVH